MSRNVNYKYIPPFIIIAFSLGQICCLEMAITRHQNLFTYQIHTIANLKSNFFDSYSGSFGKQKKKFYLSFDCLYYYLNLQIVDYFSFYIHTTTIYSRLE